MNSLLRFSIIPESLPHLPNGAFVLNETVSELRFQGSIEASGSHVLEILVEDSGSPSLSSRVTVSIHHPVDRYVVDLGLPAVAMREELWKKLIPKKAPAAFDINHYELAQR